MTKYSDKTPNYYTIIQKHLKKQYPSISKNENAVLCREVVFAPQKYPVEIRGKQTEISAVRESLADFVEKSGAEKGFIPYSLDAEIADLIESTNCETSSMNEYYRWINVTAEIVRKTSDGDVTQEDVNERQDFLAMSNTREAEIMLCLALYQAAGGEHNKDKINMLQFKLARLREMRSIVSNTAGRTRINKDRFHQYCKYCQEILGKNISNHPNINLILNIDTGHYTEEDLDNDFSYIDHIKRIILYMMRKFEESAVQNQHTNIDEKQPEINSKEQSVANTRQQHTR